MDAGSFQNPIWASSDRYIYEHETGFNYSSDTPFAESGALEIGDGDRFMNVKELIPDEKTLGSTTVTFKTANYPTATETSTGPFSMANPTSVRLTARQVRLRITGNTLTDWRYGNIRLNVDPGAGR